MTKISTVIFLSSILLSFSEYSSCQHSCHPEIVDLSRVYNFITWSTPQCSDGLQVEQYQIWFADTSEIHIQTYVTSTRSTNISCAIIDSSVCYFRVRAELSDDSVSSYSVCLNVSDQIHEKEVSIERYQDICFEVTGVCSDGLTLSWYKIEGRLPELSDYNVTHISGIGFAFCLKNVSQMVVVTEWCEFIAQNHFCFPGVGVLMLLTRTEVNLQSHHYNTTADVLYPSVTVKDSVFISTNFNMYTMSTTYTKQQPTSDIIDSEIAVTNYNNDVHNHVRMTLWIAGISSVLALTIISLMLMVLSYRKYKNSTDQQSPEPIYETIHDQPPNESLEIKENEAYLSMSRINMKQCPAYTTHRQIHMNEI